MDSNLKKKLWASADKLCSNIDAAEYKDVVLGLVFYLIAALKRT